MCKECWVATLAGIAPPAFAPLCASSFREGCIDRLSLRQLALAAAAASHSVRRMNELKIAAHVLAVRAGQVGQHLAGVVRDKLWPGVPEAPVASPASAATVSTPSCP